MGKSVELNSDHESKIVTLEVENFMSIKEAVIDFEDNNVISLCGYNDSGKSAITRLLEVMFYNTHPTDQAKFITDGEDYWKGVLTFSDGVVYTRMKFLSGRSLWKLTKDGNVIYTNELPNGTYAAIEDVPEVITKYLGVLYEEESKQQVNVRRNSDPLFLVGTTGGENYKLLNSILHSEVLSSASIALNNDKNKLNKVLSEDNTKRDILLEQYEEIDVAPEKYLNSLEEAIVNLEEDNSRLARLQDIVECLEQIKKVQIYEELTSIDYNRLIELQNIVEYLNSTKISLYDNLENVSLNRLNELKAIMSLRQEFAVDTYEELSPLSVERLKDLLNLCELFKDYSGAFKEFNDVNAKLSVVKSKLLELSQKYNLKVCKNCGSIVD